MKTPQQKTRAVPTLDQEQSLPTPPKKRSLPSLLLLPLLGILAAAGLVYGGYWYGKKPKSTTTESALSNKPPKTLSPAARPEQPTTFPQVQEPKPAANEVETTTNWKTVSNDDFNFSYKLPSVVAEPSCNQKSCLSASTTLPGKSELILAIMAEGTAIGPGSWDKLINDFNDVGLSVRLGNLKGKEVVLFSGSFRDPEHIFYPLLIYPPGETVRLEGRLIKLSNSSSSPLIFVAVYTTGSVESNFGNDSVLYETILSTFRFLDQQPPPTPSPEPLTVIEILPTDGWKTVSQKGVSYKIPPDATCKAKATSTETDDANCNLIYFGASDIIPSVINIYDYQGGSRREQFFARGYDYRQQCKTIYQEALFGSVKALQIAIDGSWCQGGGGGIVAVVGNKLVVFEHLGYDPDTKKIFRWSTRDTIISTLRSQ